MKCMEKLIMFIAKDYKCEKYFASEHLTFSIMVDKSQIKVYRYGFYSLCTTLMTVKLQLEISLINLVQFRSTLENMIYRSFISLWSFKLLIKCLSCSSSIYAAHQVFKLLIKCLSCSSSI